jgi:hypothetical protein
LLEVTKLYAIIGGSVGGGNLGNGRIRTNNNPKLIPIATDGKQPIGLLPIVFSRTNSK